jgi:hypothetical protein
VAELNNALDLAAGDNAALRAQNAYLAPRRRAGQLVANALYALDPAFYEAMRGSAVDPFNHDESVVDSLRAWRESERVIVRATIDAARTAFYQPCVERSVSAQADLDSAAMDAIEALTERIGRV